MKRYLLFFLALTGCNTASHIASSSDVTIEQKRVVSYYTGRNQGASFQPAFYQVSDSVRASLTGNDTADFRYIYRDIRAERSYDSTYHGTGDYFARLARTFGNNFDIANRGRK